MVARVLLSHWKHLRIPFQLTLAPLFLWGWALAQGAPDSGFVLAFVAFHLLLYPGITAFNSWFDRDTGPIGGLEHPPKPYRSLLPLSIALQIAGLWLAQFVSGSLGRIAFIFVVLSFFYSHPRTRWKSNPWLSLLVVVGGQGGLGFLAGWAAARGETLNMPAGEGWLGAGVAMAATLGMYPLTQVFQIEEDSRRGDRTISVVLGADRALIVSQAAFLLAGLLAVLVALRRDQPMDAGLAMAGFAALVVWVGVLKAKLPSMSRATLFHYVLRLTYGSAAGFALFVLLRVTRWN